MADENKMTAPVKSLATVKQELNAIVQDQETLKQLVSTTFNGLSVEVAKQAMLEAMFRGFKLDDFLKKNVYAVKFGQGYSLVTSIDYARRIGQKNGIVGTKRPEYTYKTEQKDGKDVQVVEACTVTILKRFEDGYIGEFEAEVDFAEYYQPGKTYNGSYTPSMWDKKPKTMIAKVAEMHALRKACPEDLSQMYDESELQREMVHVTATTVEVPEELISDWRDQITQADDQESLQRVWSNVPPEVKPHLKADLGAAQKKFADVQTGDQPANEKAS